VCCEHFNSNNLGKGRAIMRKHPPAVFLFLMTILWAQQAPPCWSQTATVAPAQPAESSMATWMRAAEDLRLAAEAAERVSDKVATTVENSLFQFSESSRQFDPFGYKTAFAVLQQQNQTIERLMQREIRRLRTENRSLIRAAKSAQAKTKPKSKGRRSKEPPRTAAPSTAAP
jgi:hypothetical protein